MNQNSEIISNVPTNIITGFLGVGKTSAILNLLQQKPDNERWAVLVNEFGEIGIDGSLFQGQMTEENGVFISEVPGGCMCCAAGLPMQIALNLLLAHAKPDRLLIEPTGLGHPIEVLETLFEDHYKEVLSIQKIITLVDARKLSDSRYTDHATFNQQIAIADVLIGNKQDLYENDERLTLENYAKTNGSSQVQVLFTEQGEFSPSLLEGKTNAMAHKNHHKHEAAPKPLEAHQEIPESGYLKAVNEGEGFESMGWRFSAEKVFDRSKLLNFFGSLNTKNVERMKAVFITSSGLYGYNLTSDDLFEMSLDEANESRIEIIASAVDQAWEEQIMQCLSATT